jgi:hypothetical protein
MYRNHYSHNQSHSNHQPQHTHVNSEFVRRFEELDEKLNEHLQPRSYINRSDNTYLSNITNNNMSNIASSRSPLREIRDDVNYYGIGAVNNYEPTESEIGLKLKWLDNSPRMSRLRDHRQKRLINKLEVTLNNFIAS